MSLFTWVPGILADYFDPTKNIIAIHNSSSDAYEKDCKKCHADIPDAQSLEPSTPAAHVAMIPFAPGRVGGDEQCIWCHRTVDLVQGSAGNLRKQVDVSLCSMCHGPFQRVIQNRKETPVQANQFYQVGLDPSYPDGPALYDLACAPCHRDLSNSSVKRKSASKIQEKIDGDLGGMGPLSILYKEEIQAIADALIGAAQ